MPVFEGETTAYISNRGSVLAPMDHYVVCPVCSGRVGFNLQELQALQGRGATSVYCAGIQRTRGGGDPRNHWHPGNALVDAGPVLEFERHRPVHPKDYDSRHPAPAMAGVLSNAVDETQSAPNTPSTLVLQALIEDPDPSGNIPAMGGTVRLTATATGIPDGTTVTFSATAEDATTGAATPLPTATATLSGGVASVAYSVPPDTGIDPLTIVFQASVPAPAAPAPVATTAAAEPPLPAQGDRPPTEAEFRVGVVRVNANGDALNAAGHIINPRTGAPLALKA